MRVFADYFGLTVRSHTCALAGLLLVGAACAPADEKDGAVASIAGNVSCPAGGMGGHVQYSSALLVGSPYFGDYFPAFETTPYRVVHTSDFDLNLVPRKYSIEVGLTNRVFDHALHQAFRDPAIYDQLAAEFAPNRDRIASFYVIDEPELSWQIPRSEIEYAIARLKERFPEIPTFVNFGTDCFDPASTSPACILPPDERGIPANVDIVSFDTYSFTGDPWAAANHVENVVEPILAKLEAMAPDKRIVLTAEAYTNTFTFPDGSQRAGQAMLATMWAMLDYVDLARRHPRVEGIHWFMAADVTEVSADGTQTVMRGLASEPALRAVANSIERQMRLECGDGSADLVPVFQWESTQYPDFRYEPWHWYEGDAAGYIADGVAFALPLPGATPASLYQCLIDRGRPGGGIDTYLTVNENCDGGNLVQPAIRMGGIFLAPTPGTVGLYRYSNGWDTAFTTSDNAQLPGYTLEFPIGWVYPPSVL